jgi:hypothetical protein
MFLLVTCILSLALALGLATFIPAAFSDPVVDYSQSGEVMVAVSDPAPPAGSKQKVGPTSVAVSVGYFEFGSEASYTYWFPRNLVGRRFVIIMTGSALLDVLEDSPLVSPPQGPDPAMFLKVRDGECAASGAWPDTCRVFAGVIPPRSASTLDTSCLPPADQQNYSPVTISGFMRMTRSLDWAHGVTFLPDLLAASTPRDIDSFEDLRLDGRFRSLDQEACKSYTPDPDWKLGDVSVASSSTTPRGDLIWKGDLGSTDVTLVSARRDAGALGNILLAAVGALAALSIGFMPVTYDSWRRWRISRRRKFNRGDADRSRADKAGDSSQGEVL